jgi:mRNA interferase MazF
MELSQYAIVWVNLDPTRGSEIRKTRPCVIISPDEMNKHLNTIVVAPMTTKSRNYPTRFKVKFNKKAGWVVLDQIKTIDKSRILNTSGNLSENEIVTCKEIINETYVC